MNAASVIATWFEELGSSQWFSKNPATDALLSERFGETHVRATQGELWSWRETSLGRLAEIIVLDQFSRQLYRDRPEAFSADALALVLAQEAVSRRCDQALNVQQRPFIYMPFMHSESARVHERAVILFSQPGLEKHLTHELRHKDIIDRFGRYPHRNAVLGRESTSEELAFLEEPGSRF